MYGNSVPSREALRGSTNSGNSISSIAFRTSSALIVCLLDSLHKSFALHKQCHQIRSQHTTWEPPNEWDSKSETSTTTTISILGFLAPLIFRAKKFPIRTFNGIQRQLTGPLDKNFECIRSSLPHSSSCSAAKQPYPPETTFRFFTWHRRFPGNQKLICKHERNSILRS